MPQPITPADGPVAVTGSAGYIGSHIVLNLIEKGYEVRACVRDATNLGNTAHLTAMNAIGPGSVTLYTCDMTVPSAGVIGCGIVIPWFGFHGDRR